MREREKETVEYVKSHVWIKSNHMVGCVKSAISIVHVTHTHIPSHTHTSAVVNVL